MSWLDDAVLSVQWVAGISDVIEMRLNLKWKLRVSNLLLLAPQGTVTDSYDSLESFLVANGVDYGGTVNRLVSAPIGMKDWYATVSLLLALDYQFGNSNSLNPALLFYQRAYKMPQFDMPRCDTTRYSNCNDDPAIAEWASKFIKSIHRSYDNEVKRYVKDLWLKKAMEGMIDRLQDHLGIFIKAAGSALKVKDIGTNIILAVGIGVLVYAVIDQVILD